MAAHEDLFQLWMLFTCKNDDRFFRQYIDAFVTQYGDLIDLEFKQPKEGVQASGPHLTRLPDSLLQVLSRQLLQARDTCTQQVTAETVQYAESLTKCLIIICRNHDNVDLVASCSYVGYIITIAAELVQEFTQRNIAQSGEIACFETFLHHAIHFCECLYDPYHNWRHELLGMKVDISRQKFRPALLNVEVIPFFYDCLHRYESCLSIEIKSRLLHMFGAIMAGSQNLIWQAYFTGKLENNALLAVSPASLEVLFTILSSGSPTWQPEGDDLEFTDLALKCLVKMVHTVHASSPEQHASRMYVSVSSMRQVEVSSILEGFLQLLNKGLQAFPGKHTGMSQWLRSQTEDKQAAGKTEKEVELQTKMLVIIPAMLDCRDRAALQAIYLGANCFENLMLLLKNVKVTKDTASAFQTAFIEAVAAILAGSSAAKETFKEFIGYDELLEHLRKFGQPTEKLLHQFLGMMVEGEFKPGTAQHIQNTKAAALLIQWVPELQSHDLQIWLTDSLRKVCSSSFENKAHCCRDGVISGILTVLAQERRVNKEAIMHLLSLLECLGSHSISPMELKHLVMLMRDTVTGEQMSYTQEVIQALCTMARKETNREALHYFDLQHRTSGITVPCINKWPGSGFSLHAWVRMDNPDAEELNMSGGKQRRQLYSFCTDNGTGFEGFFTNEGSLVIAVCYKKDYLTAQVDRIYFTDSNWHCVDVVHAGSRRPFTQSQLSVFVDGQLRINAQLKFPSTSEPFTCCRIGSSTQRTNSQQKPSNSNTAPSRGPSLPFSFPASLVPSSQSQNPSVSSIEAGSQDSLWGFPTSLQGQLGSVCVFYDALQPSQVKGLFMAGPNNLALFHHEDADITQLADKLVLYYTAKACKDYVCIDLSGNGLDGRLTGHQCTTWDLKASIKCIGGIQVLFPVLEQIKTAANHMRGVSHEPANGSTDTLGVTMADAQDVEDWVMVPQKVTSDAQLEQNPVSAFLTLLRLMLHGQVHNQEELLQSGGVATVGALLQKVKPELIDVHVLMAIQLFVEMVASSYPDLLQACYKYVLFEFRIWSRSEFPVRIGHIQYLSTIIKDQRKWFRKKYGVRFMLDICRTFYGSSVEGLTEDDVKTIRASLLGLVKYYVSKGINQEEMSAIVSYICALHDECQLCEVLDMLITLLEGPGRDQLYLLLYEPKGAELLYALLVQEQYTDTVRKRVCKVFSQLLKFDKVYEASKLRLRLLRPDYEAFAGLTMYMRNVVLSSDVTRNLLDIVLANESVGGYNAMLSIFQLLHKTDTTIKLEAARELLQVLFTRASAPSLCAKQIGWQETLVKFLVKDSLADVTQQTRPLTLDLDTSSKTSDDSVKELDFLQLPGNNGNGIPITPAGSPWRDESFLPESFPSSPLPSPVDTFPSSMSHLSPNVSSTNLSSSTSGISMSDISNVTGFTGTEDESSNNGGDRFTEQYDNGENASRSESQFSLDLLESPNAEGWSTGGNTSCNQSTASFADSGVTSSDTSQWTIGVPSSPSRVSVAESANSVVLTEDEMQEELCDVVLNAIFSILWRGMDGSDNKAWKEKAQVFTCLDKAAETHELIHPPYKLKRQLLELGLQASISDVKEAAGSGWWGGQLSRSNTRRLRKRLIGPASYSYLENAMELMKLVQDFLINHSEMGADAWSEKMVEGVMGLLDTLAVWEPIPGDSEWEDMAQIGIRLLLGFAGQDNNDVCATASAKLHTLLHSRPLHSTEEACYILGALDQAMIKSIENHSDAYSFLIPLVRALLDKCYEELGMQQYLPNLPARENSPSFFEDFQQYSQSKEWRSFIGKQVLPRMQQYEVDHYGAFGAKMFHFWKACHDGMMMNIHNRDREKGESKLRFERQIVDVYNRKAAEEHARYRVVLKRLRNQHSAALAQWRANKRFFTGERGPWTDRPPLDPAADTSTLGGSKLGWNPNTMHWKLCPLENFSRMRPKLMPNYNFNSHTEASMLRDNQGLSVSTPGKDPLLAVTKEALVQIMEEDKLGDEDWNELSTNITQPSEASQKEKQKLQAECSLVTIMNVLEGRLEITNSHVYFYDCSPNKEEGLGQDFKWSVSQLREVHMRRYNLRRSAIELFLVDQTNYFLNFFDNKLRNKVYSRILSLRPPNLRYYGSRSPADLLRASGLVQKWVQREMSNFDYLMQLNTIAGRTYNDLSQYPVFPWVLCDYTSETLDFDDPKVFRDLSKPIGVINPKNEREVREKYDTFEDPSGTIAKFHYGTHYSNAAGVMHYLLRMEPFATLHIQLQSDRFDCADRQFHSIPSTWQSLMDSPNDVKEVIPEFFYLPEFLENSNGFNLGKLQGCKTAVNNVLLPKWADSPEDFIIKHRKALESEHVSAHLHEWIDLIFGYKQKGPAAAEALNVFYYCTYEGAVDLDAITNPTERAAVEGMINNFGQTPCQLLKEPHPRRMKFEEAEKYKASKSQHLTLNVFDYLSQLKAFFVEVSNDNDPLVHISVPRSQARSFIHHGMPDAMVTISERGVVGIHGWLPYDKNISNYFTFEKDPTISHRSRRCTAGPFSPGHPITSDLFVVSHDAKLLFSGGHWDNSLRVMTLAKSKFTARVTRHNDIVTCLALDNCGNHLISGSRDTTCMIWQIMHQNGVSQGISGKPLHVLYGHDAEVTAVGITIELDMAVSASKDGTCNMYTVRKGHYMRTLRPPCTNPSRLTLPRLALSEEGHIVLYAKEQLGRVTNECTHSMHLYSINGKLLSSESLPDPLVDMATSMEYVVTGNEKGVLTVRELSSLKKLTSMPLHKQISCIFITPGNSHIMAGLEDGKLIIIGVARPAEVRQTAGILKSMIQNPSSIKML
ncbi:neurobeachin-like protein 1 isoform X5 [Branchiostoma lanceolatum]|uniref:neurobeachin-like protein 1 isoform X5 n=1 Tax=Branchiostoma lanceolatum TaxID=7740 RepID=UPI0034520257